MQFYFSGIASAEEMAMLNQAGVNSVLVNPFDLPNVSAFKGQIALDSWAYLEFKQGISYNLDTYLELACSQSFDFVVCPDKIGNPDTTRDRWNQLKSTGIPNLTPVWSWGSDIRDLHQYLDEAPIVGVGACVPWLYVDGSKKRNLIDVKADKAQRQTNLKQLVQLCQQYPQRFHIFGLCWVNAIEALNPFAASADSSYWLAGASKAQVIFVNTRTHKLSIAPARALPQASGWSREQRCIENARTIQAFTTS